MRRFLGLKSSTTSSTAQPLDSISNSNDLDNRKNNKPTKSTSTRSSSPGVPPPASKSPLKVATKSTKTGSVEEAERSIRSRHVQFYADDPTPTHQVLPTLAPQASFESRHGATGGIPCLPLKNGASSPETSQSPKLDVPGLPHAIVSHGKSGTNKETVTTVGLGLGLEHNVTSLGSSSWHPVPRTASPLSLASPSVGGSVASRGTPYSYGANSHSSLARLSERDPSQIYGKFA